MKEETKPEEKKEETAPAGGIFGGAAKTDGVSPNAPFTFGAGLPGGASPFGGPITFGAPPPAAKKEGDDAGDDEDDAKAAAELEKVPRSQWSSWK